MGMIKGGLHFPSPDPINGVHIPRRRRSCSSESKPEDGGCISIFQAATILIAMANGGYCKGKGKMTIDENENDKRKRKRAPVPATRKPRKPRKQRRKEIKLENAPEMPAAMRYRILEIGGYEIQLVIQKQLHETDINKNHGRLSFPPKKVRVEFVTEKERKFLNQKDCKNNKPGMEVLIMDPDLRESSIWLKNWKIGSGPAYCLMTNWNSFVEETHLTSGECIQIWSFRKDSFDPQTGTIASHQLCFAMVKLDISESECV